MSLSSNDALGYSTAELGSYFDKKLVPMAETLGLLGGMTYVDFMEAVAGVGVDGPAEVKFAFLMAIIESSKGPCDTKTRAKFRFTVSALCVNVVRVKDGAAPPTNRDEVLRLEGFLSALLALRADTIKRGANGRRLIGATARDRARRAAEDFRGTMTREQAAPLIAEMIGKQPSTVRRMLSQLFPGTAWSNDPCADSTDSE